MTDQHTESKTNAHNAATDKAGDADEQIQDDAIIGRVFWWSVGVAGAAGLAIAITLFALSSGGQAETVVKKDPGEIADLSQTTPTRPDVTFTDITKQAGIDFVHENGAMGDKLLPETLGGGGAFFDYDNDGDQDLLLTNSTYWPDADVDKAEPTAALYENDGTGRFTDVTEQAGLDFSCYGMGCAIGDYDNDGDDDVFFTAVGKNHLFRNDDGRFTKVTGKANVAGDENEWSTSAGFFDYDNDGDLDLFVCNYVK